MIVSVAKFKICLCASCDCDDGYEDDVAKIIHEMMSEKVRIDEDGECDCRSIGRVVGELEIE